MAVSLFPACVFAGSITGLWQTIDDETGEPKSIVSVYKQGEQFFGRILFTYTDGSPDLIDNGAGGLKCDPAKKASEKLGKDIPYCGLVFLKDLELSKSGKYTGGKITDPKKGKTYDASAELAKDGTLTVRGMLGGGLLKALGRNQTWIPVKPEDMTKGFTY